MLIAAEKYCRSLGPYIASAVAHIAVLIWANQPVSERHAKTDAENAIQVEIVDIREWSERSAQELSKSASNQQENIGKAGEAVAPTPSPETPIKKPEQIENGWRRSAEILSKAELSNPNPRSRN